MKLQRASIILASCLLVVLAGCPLFVAQLTNPVNPAHVDITNFIAGVEPANDACRRAIKVKVNSAAPGDFAANYPAFWREMSKIPKAWKTLADSNLIYLRDFRNLQPWLMSSDLFDLFVKHTTRSNEHCMRWNEAMVDGVAASTTLAPRVSAQCFSYFPRTAPLVAPSGITNFGKEILKSRTNQITEAHWYLMTKDQLENYQNAAHLKPTRCQRGFNLSLLHKDLISRIPADCLTNWLEYNVNRFDAEKVAGIKKLQLKKLTAQGAKNLATVIDTHEDKLNKDVVNFLAESNIYSSSLKHLSIKKGIIVKKKEVFTAMKAETKLAVLERASALPDNILEDTLPDEIARFDNNGFALTEKAKCTGYQCLNLIEKYKNAKAILSKLNDYHCIDRKLSSLSSATTFVKNMSRSCFKQCEDARSLDQYHDLDENVYKYISVELVKKAFLGDWKSHAEDYIKNKSKKNYNSIWRGVLRNPKVCRSLVKLKTFKTLRKHKLAGAMSAFSSECCRSMRFFSKLEGEDLKAIGPHVYSSFTKAEKARINLEKATSEQIARISSNVTDLSTHYAAQVTSDTLAAYSPELVASFPEPWFRAFPAETYAGFTHEQFEGIVADNTVNMTGDKIEKLSEEVMKGLTSEQISLIGSGANQEKEVVTILEKYVGGYDETQKKAYNLRIDAPGSGAVSLAVAGLVSFTVGLSLLIPLL